MYYIRYADGKRVLVFDTDEWEGIYLYDYALCPFKCDYLVRWYRGMTYLCKAKVPSLTKVVTVGDLGREIFALDELMFDARKYASRVVGVRNGIKEKLKWEWRKYSYGEKSLWYWLYYRFGLEWYCGMESFPVCDDYARLVEEMRGLGIGVENDSVFKKSL